MERLFEETIKDAAGFLSNRERGNAIPLERITEANDLIYDSIYRGQRVEPHVREFLLREAITTSDFPYLLASKNALANPGGVMLRNILVLSDFPPSCCTHEP